MSEPMTGGRPASGRATAALVVGIVGIVCCQLAGPVAWYLGNAELRAIATGAAPAAGEGLAKAGKILGIVGTILLVMVLAWVAFVGVGAAMAILSGIAESTR